MEAQVSNFTFRMVPRLTVQYRTINRGGDSIFDMVRAAGYEP